MSEAPTDGTIDGVSGAPTDGINVENGTIDGVSEAPTDGINDEDGIIDGF